MKSRLTRFVVEEFFAIFSPVFFGLVIMAMSLRFAKIYELGAIDLPVGQLLLIMLFLLPAVSLLVVPVSFLIAVSITVTKLSSTSEILALQSTGVSPRKILKIFAVIAALVTASTLVISLFVKPYCAYLVRKTLESVSQGHLVLVPQEKMFKKIYEDTFLYVSELKNDKMEGVIFFVNKGLNSSTLVTSRSCFIDNKAGTSVFNFENGTYLKVDMLGSSVLDFKRLRVNPFEDITTLEHEIERGAMPLSSLVKRLQEPAVSPMLRAEFYYRIFFPLSVFVFLFLSFPFSFGHSKNYKTSGIVISLVTGLVFYVFFSVSNSMAAKGLLSPLIGFPVTIFSLIGAGLGICLRKFPRIKEPWSS